MTWHLPRVARRWGTGVVATAVSVLVCLACSKKQDYCVVPTERRDELLRMNAFVVEGRVSRSGTTLRAPLSQYIFFWIPVGAVTTSPRHDTTVVVEAVLKGEPHVRTVRLRDHGPLRARDRSLFPDGYLHMNSLLRVGYDRRRGDRFTGLTLCPLGNTPEFDEAMRQAVILRARRAASRPVVGQR